MIPIRAHGWFWISFTLKKISGFVIACLSLDHQTWTLMRFLIKKIQVELVDPPKSATVGERVTFPGFSGEPDDVLNPKKKVWETLQVDLNTNTELVALYKDIPFTTSAGVCTVSSIASGSIR